MSATKDVPIDDIVAKYKHGLRFNAGTVERDYGLTMAPVRKTASRPSFRPAYQIVVDVWNGARFVLDTGDLDRSTNRIVTYVEENSSPNSKEQIWWVRPTDPSISQADQELKLRQWLDSMDAELPDFDLLSDFDPANLGRGGSAGLRADYNAFRRVRLSDGVLVEMTHKPEDGGLYVLLTGGRVKWTNPDGTEYLMETCELNRLIGLVRTLTGNDPLDGRTLIGIIGNSHGLVNKHAGWQSLQDLLNGVVAAEIDEADLRASARAWSRDKTLANPYNEEGRTLETLIANSHKLAEDLPDDHLFGQISRDRLDCQAPTRYAQSNIEALRRWFKIDVPEFKPFKAAHISLAKSAFRVYPLLRALNLNHAGLDIADVRQYIIQVDAAGAAASDATEGDAA